MLTHADDVRTEPLVTRQTRANQILRIVRHLWGFSIVREIDRRRIVDDILRPHILLRLSFAKGAAAVENLKENNARRPHVDFRRDSRRIGSFLEAFRGQIPIRSRSLRSQLHTGAFMRLVDDLRQPKVYETLDKQSVSSTPTPSIQTRALTGDFDVSELIEENIGGFQIKMND